MPKPERSVSAVLHGGAGRPRAPVVPLPLRAAATRSARPAAGAEFPDALRHHALFAGLDEARVARLLHGSRMDTLESGERLYERGQRASHFFVVVEGRLNLALCSRTGDVKVLEILRPGQVCGEAAMFAGDGAYPVSAYAASLVRVARIANRDYLAVLAESPGACLRMIRHLTERLGRHIHQIEYTTLDSATHRLARVLQSRLPDDAEGREEIALAETRQELASFLSMKPETLSRALRVLSSSGVIAVRGRTVAVLDREALLRHAASSD